MNCFCRDGSTITTGKVHNFQKILKVSDGMTPKEEFIKLIEGAGLIKGRDALSSSLQAILYAEPEELSLEELAERSGYSLSAVSTAMKYLTPSGKIQRIKKPGSRKAYFYMEKDMLTISAKMMENLNRFTASMRKKLPEIRERYRKEKPEAKGEIEIIENYQKQMQIIEEIFEDIVNKLKEAEV